MFRGLEDGREETRQCYEMHKEAIHVPAVPGVPLEVSRVWAPVGKSRRWGSPWASSDGCSPAPSPPRHDHHPHWQSSLWRPLWLGRRISKNIPCSFCLIFLTGLWRKSLHLPFGWGEDRGSVMSRNSLSWFFFRQCQSWDCSSSMMVTSHHQLERVERCLGADKGQSWVWLWRIFQRSAQGVKDFPECACNYSTAWTKGEMGKAPWIPSLPLPSPSLPFPSLAAMNRTALFHLILPLWPSAWLEAPKHGGKPR